LALDEVPIPVHDPDAPQTLPPGIPAIAFDRASLRYDPSLPLALNEVTLQLEPGATLAVTGSSGAGKSSLISALLRFWPLAGGTLRVGGVAVEQLRQSDVRTACALVDQGAHLFAGTLHANLTLGRPEASTEEVARALQTAQLAEWVAGLPDGLDTPVGDEGVAISGGERRRVAVARALIASGPVLVLDEPTSGLQTPMADRLITDVLASAAQNGRSVLLVTHRDAEANLCQGTLTLQDGSVVA
jgi:ABC-type multidrug transport system fused ATPase/permease subunit